MFKRLTTKVQRFISKRKEIKRLILQVENSNNDDHKTDLIITMFNEGFRREAIAVATKLNYKPIEIKNEYNYSELKKDFNYIATACSFVIIGFLIVMMLTK